VNLFIGKVMPNILDLAVMPIKERMRVRVINQPSNHATYAAVLYQIGEKPTWVIINQSLFCHLGSNVTALKFFLK
jgi:hypothetical protein